MMGRNKKYGTVLRIRVTPTFLKKIDEVAKKYSITRSDVIRKGLLQILISESDTPEKMIKEFEPIFEPIMKPIGEKFAEMREEELGKFKKAIETKMNVITEEFKKEYFPEYHREDEKKHKK